MICPLATNDCRPKGTGWVDAARQMHLYIIIQCHLTWFLHHVESKHRDTRQPAAHLHPSIGTATRWARSTESPIAKGASTWSNHQSICLELDNCTILLAQHVRLKRCKCLGADQSQRLVYRKMCTLLRPRCICGCKDCEHQDAG